MKEPKEPEAKIIKQGDRLNLFLGYLDAGAFGLLFITMLICSIMR